MEKKIINVAFAVGLAVLTLGVIADTRADVTIQSGNYPVGPVSVASVTSAGAISGTAISGTTIVGTTSLTIGGSSPTAITNIRVYGPTCTPTQSTAAIQTHTLACTVTGITTADKVLVNPPGNQSLCPLVNARASGTDTVTLSFAVLTAAACTPTAGVYTVVAFRS